MIEFENRQNVVNFTDDIKKVLKSAIECALKFEKFKNPYEVDVTIVDNKEIRKINKKFRNIDRETDVLSFPMLRFKDGQGGVDEDDINPDTNEVVLGDVVLSFEKALSQSKEYEHSFEREAAYLTVHSVLHLLGFDHEIDNDKKKMRIEEEKIMNEIGL